MSARKKSRPTHKTKSPIIVVYKYIIVSLVVVLAGATLADVFTTILGGGQVLGTRTLLARGEGVSRGQSGQGEYRGPSIKEIEISEQSRGGQGGIKQENFQEKLPPPGSSADKDMMFIRLQDEEEEIATDGGSVNPKRHRGAISHFPISINPETNEMTITTPAGVKVVTILPDQAVENMLTKGIISKIGGHIASGSGDLGGEDSSTSAIIQSEDGLGEVNENVELTEEDGVPVYKIKGQKEKRFFGLIPVTIDKTVTVSAETGEIESTQLTPFERLLDLLSL